MDLELGGRNPVPLHELLRENLRSFELRGLLRRPEEPQAAGFEDVPHAGDERRFAARDGERDALAARDLG
jgi:hypothetical protein